jgi:hypothetical protein
MMLGPPSSGRCCDAFHACGGRVLDVRIFSNKEQVAIHFAKKGVSIITPQA